MAPFGMRFERLDRHFIGDPLPHAPFSRMQNTLRFASRALFPARGYLPGPYKINLMVTSRCNQRCSSCRIWTREAADLPLGLIERLLSSVPDLSWLDVTGGEILLRPDIEDVFETISRQSRRLALLHFPTNGSLPDRTVRLARASAGGPARLVVTVSLDGPPALHDAMRGKEGAWAAAVETFRRLRELRGCRVLFGMTLSSDNLEAYPDTLKAAREAVGGLRPSDLHVNIAHASHYYRTEAVKPLDTDRLVLALDAIERSRGGSMTPVGYAERRYLRRAPDYLRTGRSPVPCRALLATCFVDVSGTVTPCVTWDNVLGRLDETGGDLRPIWRSAAAAAARERIARDECPGCWTPCEAVPAILGDILGTGRR